MGGDADQWLEDAVFGVYREARGGDFSGDSSDLQSTGFAGGPPSSINETIGFRVAYVPEPSTAALLASAAVVGFLYLKHSRPAKREQTQLCDSDS